MAEDNAEGSNPGTFGAFGDWVSKTFGDTGVDDVARLAATYGLANSSFAQSQAKPTGYQGTIPRYTAYRKGVPTGLTRGTLEGANTTDYQRGFKSPPRITRQQYTPYEENRRPGAYGRRYFTDTTYAKQGDDLANEAARSLTNRQAEALFDFNENNPIRRDAMFDRAAENRAARTEQQFMEDMQNAYDQGASPATPEGMEQAPTQYAAMAEGAGGIQQLAAGGIVGRNNTDTSKSAGGLSSILDRIRTQQAQPVAVVEKIRQQPQAKPPQPQAKPPQMPQGGPPPQMPQGGPPPQMGQRPPMQGQRPPMQGQRPPMQGQRPPMQGQRPPPQMGQRPPMQGQRPPQRPMGQMPQGQRPPMQGQRPPQRPMGQMPQGQRPTNLARGGQVQAGRDGRYNVGGIVGLPSGGRYLNGMTDGMADQRPATIDNNAPAALSDGEFVIPADVVSHMGNGNSNAGADALSKMLEDVRQERTGSTQQGREIDPAQFFPTRS